VDRQCDVIIIIYKGFVCTAAVNESHIVCTAAVNESHIVCTAAVNEKEMDRVFTVFAFCDGMAAWHL